MSETYTLRPDRLSLADLRRLDDPAIRVELDPSCRERIRAGADVIAGAIRAGRAVYGVNTGFGPLSNTLIPESQLGELQRRVVLSNAVGVGPLLDDRVVRRIMILKVATVALGLSGVREEMADALLALVNAGVHPCIPAKGSCGASGDLAPLAHLGAGLLGVGDVRVAGERMPAADGLRRTGLEPFTLGPKEGLAIVNGTQVSTALALEGLFATERVFAAALHAGALALEAGGGTAAAFDRRIHDARRQRGQGEAAAAMRALLEGSGLQRSGGSRLQDPYCLRCQPQVMGAALDQVRSAADILHREIGGASDNPLVDPDSGEVLYGGNFHAQPIGLAADTLALALAEIGSMAERRIAFLVDEHMSGLPAFLVAEGGLNSGFMVAHTVAAALASENKAVAHPGSVDSLPTAANQEDYVSMATYAARRLGEMADNAAGIVAIELLAACQGLEFRRPGRSSAALEAVAAAVRERVPAWEEDRFFAPDVAAAKGLVEDQLFLARLPGGLLPSHSQAPAGGRPL